MARQALLVCTLLLVTGTIVRPRAATKRWSTGAISSPRAAELGETDPVLVPPGRISDKSSDPALDDLVNGLIGSMRKAEAENKPLPRVMLPEGGGSHDVPDRYDTNKSLAAWLPPSPCRCNVTLNHERPSCHLESLLFGDKRRWCRVQRSEECPHQFRYCSHRPFDKSEKELQQQEETASVAAKEERGAVPKRPVREVSNKVREKIRENATVVDEAIEEQMSKAERASVKHARYIALMKQMAKAHGAMATEEQNMAAAQARVEAVLAQEEKLRQKVVSNMTKDAHGEAVQVQDARSELTVEQEGLKQKALEWLTESQALDAKVETARAKAKAKETEVEAAAVMSKTQKRKDAKVVSIWKAKEAETNTKIELHVQEVKAARAREAKTAEQQSMQGVAVKDVSEKQSKETLNKWKMAEALVETRSQKWRKAERDAAEARAEVLQGGFDVQVTARGVADAGREMRQAARASEERKVKLAAELTDEEARWKRRVSLAQGTHKRETRLAKFADMRVRQVKERIVKEKTEKDKGKAADDAERADEVRISIEQSKMIEARRLKRATKEKKQKSAAQRYKVKMKKEKIVKMLKEKVFKKESEKATKELEEKSKEKRRKQAEMYEVQQKQAEKKDEKRNKIAEAKSKKEAENFEKTARKKEIRQKRILELKQKLEEQSAEKKLKEKDTKAEKNEKAEARAIMIKITIERQRVARSMVKVKGPELKLGKYYKWIKGHEPQLASLTDGQCRGAFNSGIAKCTRARKAGPQTWPDSTVSDPPPFKCGCKYGLLALYKSAAKFQSSTCAVWYGKKNIDREIMHITDFINQQKYMTKWGQSCAVTAGSSKPYRSRAGLPPPNIWLKKLKKQTDFDWAFEPIFLRRTLGSADNPACVSEFYVGVATCTAGSVFKARFTDPTSNTSSSAPVGDGCQRKLMMTGVYGHIQSMRSQEPAMQKSCIAAHFKWSAEAVAILRDAPIQAVMIKIQSAVAQMMMNPIKMPKLQAPEGFKMSPKSVKQKDMRSKLGCVARLALGHAHCHNGPEHDGFFCGCTKGKAMVVVTASALSGRKPKCIRWYRLVVRATQIAESQELAEQRDWMGGWVQACAVGQSKADSFTKRLLEPDVWLHKMQKQPSFQWASKPSLMTYTYKQKDVHSGVSHLVCQSDFAAGVAVCNKGKTVGNVGLGCKGNLFFAGMYGEVTYMQDQKPPLQKICATKHIDFTQMAYAAALKGPLRKPMTAVIKTTARATGEDEGKCTSVEQKKSWECKQKSEERQDELEMKQKQKQHEAKMKAHEKATEEKQKARESKALRELDLKKKARKEKTAKAETEQRERLEQHDARHEAAIKAREQADEVGRKAAATKLKLIEAIERKSKRKTQEALQKAEKSNEASQKQDRQAQEQAHAAKKADMIAKLKLLMEQKGERKAKDSQKELNDKASTQRNEEHQKSAARRRGEELAGKKAKADQAQIILARAREKMKKVDESTSRDSAHHGKKLALLNAVIKRAKTGTTESLTESKEITSKSRSTKMQLTTSTHWQIDFSSQQGSNTNMDSKMVVVKQNIDQSSSKAQALQSSEKQQKASLKQARTTAKESTQKRTEHNQREAKTKAMAKKLAFTYLQKLSKLKAKNAARNQKDAQAAQELGAKHEAEASARVKAAEEQSLKTAQRLHQAEKQAKMLQITAIAEAKQYERQKKVAENQRELGEKAGRVRLKLKKALERRAAKESTAKEEAAGAAAHAKIEAAQQELKQAEERSSKRKLQEREQKSTHGKKGKLQAMLRAKAKEKSREMALERGAKQLDTDQEKDIKKAHRAQAAEDKLKLTERHERESEQTEKVIEEKQSKQQAAIQKVEEKTLKITEKKARLFRMLKRRKVRQAKQAAKQEREQKEEAKAAEALKREGEAEGKAAERADKEEAKAEQAALDQREGAREAKIEQLANLRIVKQQEAADQKQQQAAGEAQAKATQQRVRGKQDDKAARRALGEQEMQAENGATAAAEKMSKRNAKQTLGIKLSDIKQIEADDKRKETNAFKLAAKREEATDERLGSESRAKQRVHELTAKQKIALADASTSKLKAAERDDKTEVVREKIEKAQTRGKEKKEKKEQEQLEVHQKQSNRQMIKGDQQDESAQKVLLHVSQRTTEEHEMQSKQQDKAIAQRLKAQERQLKAAQLATLNSTDPAAAVAMQKEMAVAQNAAEGKQKRREELDAKKILAMEGHSKARAVTEEKNQKMSVVREKLALLLMRKKERKGKRTEKGPKKESEKKALEIRLQALDEAAAEEQKSMQRLAAEVKEKHGQALQQQKKAEEAYKMHSAKEQISKKEAKSETKENGIKMHKQSVHEKRNKELVREKKQKSHKQQVQYDLLSAKQERELSEEELQKKRQKTQTNEVEKKMRLSEGSAQTAAKEVSERELKVQGLDSQQDKLGGKLETALTASRGREAHVKTSEHAANEFRVKAKTAAAAIDGLVGAHAKQAEQERVKEAKLKKQLTAVHMKQHTERGVKEELKSQQSDGAFTAHGQVIAIERGREVVGTAESKFKDQLGVAYGVNVGGQQFRISEIKSQNRFFINTDFDGAIEEPQMLTYRKALAELPLLKPPAGFGILGEQWNSTMTSDLACIASFAVAVAKCQKPPKRNGHFCGCRERALIALSESVLEPGDAPECLTWYDTVLQAMEDRRVTVIKQEQQFLEEWSTACTVHAAEPGTASEPWYNPLPEPDVWLHKKHSQFAWIEAPNHQLYTYEHNNQTLCKSEFMTGVAVCQQGRTATGNWSKVSIGPGCKPDLMLSGMYGQLTFLENQQKPLQKICTEKHVQWTMDAMAAQKDFRVNVTTVLEAAAKGMKPPPNTEVQEAAKLLRVKGEERDAKTTVALQQVHDRAADLKQQASRIKRERLRDESGIDQQIVKKKSEEIHEKAKTESVDKSSSSGDEGRQMLLAQEKSGKQYQLKLLESQDRAMQETDASMLQRLKQNKNLLVKTKAGTAHGPAGMDKLAQVEAEVQRIGQAERTEKQSERDVAVEVKSRKDQLEVTVAAARKVDYRQQEQEKKAMRLIKKEKDDAAHEATKVQEKYLRKSAQLSSIATKDKEEIDQVHKRDDAKAARAVAAATAEGIAQGETHSYKLLANQEKESKQLQRQMMVSQEQSIEETEKQMRVRLMREKGKMDAMMLRQAKGAPMDMKLLRKLKEKIRMTELQRQAENSTAAVLSEQEQRVKQAEIKAMSSNMKALNRVSNKEISEKTQSGEARATKGEQQATTAKNRAIAAGKNVPELQTKVDEVRIKRSETAKLTREKRVKIETGVVILPIQPIATANATVVEQSPQKAGSSELSREKLRKAEAREALLSKKQELTEELKEKSELKVAELSKQLLAMKRQSNTESPTVATDAPTAAPTAHQKWWTKRLKNLTNSAHFRAPMPKAEAKDCKMGGWKGVGQCSSPCDGGLQNQTRNVLVHAAGSGKKCGELKQQITCNIQPCCFPHCPPDVSKEILNDMTWLPPEGCSCRSHTYCDMKSLLTRGPHSVDSMGETKPGSQMWCHSREQVKGCKHGWAWCSQNSPKAQNASASIQF